MAQKALTDYMMDWYSGLVNGAVLVTDGAFSSPIDDTGTYVYLGKAPPATDGATAAWQVTRITSATGSAYIATGPGASTTTQIWDNRTSLTYTEA
jgi:hypothetical protein